jgi:hypothetical protein
MVNIMKRYILTLFLLFSFSLFSMSAQEADSLGRADVQRVRVKLNALAVVGVVNPAVEVRVWNYLSVQLDFMGVFAPKNFMGTGYPLSLGTGFAELRYYPVRTFKGFFCAANVGFGIFRMNKNIYPKFITGYEKNPDSIFVGQSLLTGLTIGWSFNLPKCWGIEIFWGGGYTLSGYESYTPMEDGGISHREWNKSAEWLPAYKGGVCVSYTF